MAGSKRGDANEPIQHMCWRKFTRSIEQNVWWKRCAMPGVLLAVVAPDWLRSQVQPEWLERYGSRASEYRFPSGADKRQQFLHQVGQDGWGLLAAMQADPQSHWMLSI